MNETVRNMVERLFENTVMNDETQALRDEVLNNCLERCADLTEKGLPEEEILAAVSESLKGMEEIVDSYPKKEQVQQPLTEEAFSKSPEGHLHFEPSAVSRLTVRLPDASAEILPTDDPEITVELVHNPDTELTAVLDGDTLRISQRRALIPSGGTADTTSRPSVGRAPWDNVASGINDAIRQLTQIVQRFVSTSSVSTDNFVRVLLPRSCRLIADIQSLSGDIHWNGPAAECLLLDTTSGDLEAFAPAGEVMKIAQCKSASGDVHLDLDAEDCSLQSMSGDLRWSGNAERLTATSVSGDVEIAGSFPECRLKSVSGDVSVNCEDSPTLINAVSTSGDITVQLPASVPAAKAALRTISGNTHVNNLLISDTAPLTIRADSVSGDISLTRHKM